MGIISILTSTVAVLNMVKPIPADNYYSWYSRNC